MRYAFDRMPSEAAGALRLASRLDSFSMQCDCEGCPRARQGRRASCRPGTTGFPDRGRAQGQQQSLWRHRLLLGLHAPRGRRETCAVIPQTRYARTADGVHIAYQVHGDGPIDLLMALGWTTNIEALWEEPSQARFLNRLA